MLVIGAFLAAANIYTSRGGLGLLFLKTMRGHLSVFMMFVLKETLTNLQKYF